MNNLSPRSLVVAVAACLLGVILALVGAELPADASFVQALAFWLTITGTTAILLTTVSSAINGFTKNLELSRPLAISLSGAATILLVTLPVALMCLSVDTLSLDSDSLFETSAETNPISALFWGWADQYLNLLPAIGGFWCFVEALGFALPAGTGPTALEHERRDLFEHQAERAGAENQPSKAGLTNLERRFPIMAGRTLLAIEADEHYVRFHTSTGKEHVLYRFRDALKDVDDVPGLRVHRSWWVAKDAIDHLEQSGSGVGLRLDGGLTVPVSQTYRRDVERMIEERLQALSRST